MGAKGVLLVSKGQKPPIPLRLPDELVTRIEAHAEASYTNRNGAIRDLIERGLATLGAAEPAKPSAPRAAKPVEAKPAPPIDKPKPPLEKPEGVRMVSAPRRAGLV